MEKKISELTTFPAAVTGNESIPAVQGSGTHKFPLKDVAKYGYQDVVTDSTSSRTLSLADRGAWLRFTNATATTVTVPTNASVAFSVGESINGIQAAAGKVLVSAEPGVTVNVPAEYKNNTRAQGSPFCLIKVGTNAWDLIGDLEAL